METSTQETSAPAVLEASRATGVIVERFSEPAWLAEPETLWAAGLRCCILDLRAGNFAVITNANGKRQTGEASCMALIRALIRTWRGATKWSPVLAATVDDRLFCAGEATSLEFFPTCHGADLTSCATARAVALVAGVTSEGQRHGTV